MNNVFTGKIFQYVVAIFAIMAIVVLNIWGKNADYIINFLFSIVGAGIWGGAISHPNVRQIKSVDSEDSDKRDVFND